MGMKQRLLATSVAGLLVSGLMVSPVQARSADVVLQEWLASPEFCEALPETACLITETGWALAIQDADASLLDRAVCISLPTNHGAYVEMWNQMQDYLQDPIASTVLGTGACGHEVVDANDEVLAGDANTLADPIGPAAARASRSAAPIFEALPGSQAPQHVGQGTFFNPGLGACGHTDNDSSLIVALAASDFDEATPNGSPNRNPVCGKKIKITRGDRAATSTVIATVDDRCQSCQTGDVDMSISVFDQIADPSEGRVPVQWAWVS